jgi:tetratricopeptide (TPR) repeat protein
MRHASDPARQGYLSVPPAPVARAVLGFENLAADSLYMRFASYWGYQLTHGRHFQNLAPILNLIVDLDPRFKPAYDLGALALADSGQVNAAVALLDKGATHHPNDYWFPYQAGFTLFFFGDDYLRAAGYFQRAASKPGAPPEARYFVARMYEQATRKDLAIQVWQRTLVESRDPSIRQVAKNSLERLGSGEKN